MFASKLHFAMLLVLVLVAVTAPGMFVAAQGQARVLLPLVRTPPPPPPSTLARRHPSSVGGLYVEQLAWGGQNWTTLFALAQAEDLITKVPGGLYRSTNAGLSWEHLSMGVDVAYPIDLKVLSVHPITPTLLFATVGNQLFRSDDTGTTWRTNLAGLTDRRVHDIAIDRNNPNRIYANGGPAYILGGGWPVVGTYISDDAGLTWRHQSDEKMEDDWFEGIAVDPSDSKILYGSRGRFLNPIEGAYRSDDEGRSWAQLNQYPNSHVLVDPSTPGRIYQFGGLTYGTDGFMRSDDSGRTWKSITPDDSGVSYLHSGTVYTVGVDPRFPDILWAGMHYSGLWRSVDAGMTWEHMAGRSGTFGLECTSIAIAPNGTLAVVLNSSVYVGVAQ